MKIYLSADIEGITGACHRDEIFKDKKDYKPFQTQMTAEVLAACEGALAAGAKEIWVKDAHGDARNIDADKLPKEARLIRGWSGHPAMMMQEIDNSFEAAIMIGYHSGAGLAGSALEHTLCGRYSSIKINDQLISEFHINAFTAAMHKVPVVFLSGDQMLCDQVEAFNPSIITCRTMQGVGQSTISEHPKTSLDRIHTGVKEALSSSPGKYDIKLPGHFKVDIRCRDHMLAYKNSFYPGAKLTKDPFVFTYEADDYMDVLKMLTFTFPGL